MATNNLRALSQDDLDGLVGEVLSDDMPWENFGRFDDDSLNAVYEFPKIVD